MAFYGKYYIVLCRFNMKIQYGINKIIFKTKVASGRIGCRFSSHIPVRFLQRREWQCGAANER